MEADAYCPEVMKELSAVQGLLEGASRIMLRRHLETCVATAMQQGRTAEIVDELMETLKFDKHVFRTPQVTEPDLPAAGAPGQDGTIGWRARGRAWPWPVEVRTVIAEVPGAETFGAPRRGLCEPASSRGENLGPDEAGEPGCGDGPLTRGRFVGRELADLWRELPGRGTRHAPDGSERRGASNGRSMR